MIKGVGLDEDYNIWYQADLEINGPGTRQAAPQTLCSVGSSCLPIPENAHWNTPDTLHCNDKGSGTG